ncbi:hypothetical protein GCM10011387_02890 [Pedobacter quisquiliarum]|jgi:hypothetical protein|uniref:Glycerophosphoryl diester phosphodiesterase membrane domain-containing protein n=1 Tax=Pedobacter quisquiliarum TaxID=1834438 RepID=A0A916X7T2_9SPHI|nr:hypothetical protein [Pedobacter quisquiliarum]GGC52789.1 hypothetical protein GCM10011387_02890 [Pedobacter quisquiliarum]
MINFLKESTFTVNEVIGKAWRVTYDNYFSLATLCFLIFITFTTSSLMAFFLKDVNIALRILMVFLFIVLYCTINLSLFKYILHLLDNENEQITIVSTLPTRVQIIRFLIATFYFALCIVFVGVLLYPVLFILDPLLRYAVRLGLVSNLAEAGRVVTNVSVAIAIVAIFITFIRISFFQFFIIDKQAKPFQAIKYSLATTRGNFTKILLLLLVLGFFHLLSLVFNYLHWSVISLLVISLSSFIIVPLSSVALTIVYRKMMAAYDGTEEPDIIHNIV